MPRPYMCCERNGRGAHDHDASERRLSSPVSAILLAVRKSGMGWRVEREPIEVWHVIRVHAITQLVVRRPAEPGHKYSGYRAKSDIDHIISDAASSKRPTGVIASERSQAVLLRRRLWRNAEVNPRD